MAGLQTLQQTKQDDRFTADSGFLSDGTGFGRFQGITRLPDGTFVDIKGNNLIQTSSGGFRRDRATLQRSDTSIQAIQQFTPSTGVPQVQPLAVTAPSFQTQSLPIKQRSGFELLGQPTQSPSFPTKSNFETQRAPLEGVFQFGKGGGGDTETIQPFLQPFDIAGQKAEGEGFIGQLGTAIPQIRGRIETQLGLPGLRELQAGLGEAITGVTGQIRGVPDVVTGTTRESLVTEGQRQRLVAKQQEPLREQLVRLAESQAAISPQLEKLEALGQQRFQAGMLPFQLGFSLLQDRQAREFSGYTQQNQLELDRLLANQAAGIQLSEGEKNRLNQLAVAEAGYRNELEQIKEKGAQERETAEEDLVGLFTSLR